MTVSMNRPFEDVDNHFLRHAFFIAEPNYIMPGRKQLTKIFNETAAKVKEDLKKKIIQDLNEAGHKTISVTLDHGTNCDVWRSKKNVVTIARTTKDFVIKKDIVKMINCNGSQTGRQIRLDILKALRTEQVTKKTGS